MSSLFEVEHLKNLIYNAAALLALCLKQSIEIIPDIHEYSLSNNGTFNRFSKFSWTQGLGIYKEIWPGHCGFSGQ